MELRILKDYQFTKAEIEQVENHIKELEDRLEKLKEETVIDVVQAGDIKTGHRKIEGMPIRSISFAEAQLERNRFILECRKNKLLVQRNDVEQFIADCDDSRARILMTKKFIEGKTWQQIANETPGYNEQALRRYLTRYLAATGGYETNGSVEKLMAEQDKKYVHGNA